MIRIHSMLVMVARWSKNQNQPNQHTKDQRKGQLNPTTTDQWTTDLVTKTQLRRHLRTDQLNDQPKDQPKDQLRDQPRDQPKDRLSDQSIRLIVHREYHQECQFHHTYDQMGRKF